MNHKITPIRESDFEELLALFQGMADFQNLPDNMFNTLERMKAEKEYLTGFTVRNEQGEMIGYATYFFAYYTWQGKCLYMDDLFVREDYRGRGVGKELIQNVIGFARKNHCHKLRWMVGAWNENAIRFYKSLGAEIDHVEMACNLMLD